MRKIFTIILTLVVTFSLFSVSVLATGAEGASSESANVFAEIYNEVIKHSDKILSALAFLASLVLAFAYRKGLIPLLKGGINTLTSAVTKLKEQTEKAGEISEKTIAEAKENLTRAEEALLSLNERLESLKEEIARITDEQTKASSLKIILESQIDMLYEIFMSSSIPLYQKESVGEKIFAMKKKLGISEGESND